MSQLRAKRTEKDNLFEMETQTEDGWIKAPGTPRLQGFITVVGYASTGHDHYAYHWVSTLTAQEDGRLVFFDETFGNLYKIAAELVRLKDNLLLENIWVYPDNNQTTEILRRWEGISYYKKSKGVTGKDIYTTDPTKWDTFRGHDNIASVCELPEDIAAEPEAGLEATQALAAEGKVTIRPACPRHEWILRQPPPAQSIIRHPLAKAMGAATMMGLRLFNKTEPDARQEPATYHNRRR